MNAASRPRRGHVWSRGLVLGLGILVALACSEASEPVDPGAQQTLSTDVAQRLLALGYVGWDDDADATLSGAIWHAKERAAEGLNLFTNDSDTVWLMDGDGVFLREWVLPGRQHCEHVELISGPRLAVVCEGDPQAWSSWIQTAQC